MKLPAPQMRKKKEIYRLTSGIGKGEGNSLQLQPRTSKSVEIYGLDSWDLHRVHWNSCSRRSCSLTLPELGQRLHRSQRDLWACGILNLDGLPAHLTVGADGVQEDGPCVGHDLKILKPFLANRGSGEYLTAGGRDCAGLNGLEGRSAWDDLLRLEKDLLWLVPFSVFWLYRDTQSCCVLLKGPRHHTIAALRLGKSVRSGSLCSGHACCVRCCAVRRRWLLLLRNLVSGCVAAVRISPCAARCSTDGQQRDVSV